MTDASEVTKQTVVADLYRDLQKVIEMREDVTRSALAAARVALRTFQMARLSRSHADYLANEETRAAAHFFLEDIYGFNDYANRDQDIVRVVPMMERLLPLMALRYIAEAIELDCLSETLDCAMAERLGENFTEQDYVKAYRTVGNRTQREDQIRHIESVGCSLCDMVNMPLMGATIKAMRVPAKLARLSELHSFLDTGFCAFKQMKQPAEFVTTIIKRETTILNNLYAGKADPFSY